MNFLLLPLIQIAESKSNPRKSFDQAKLAELAESIRASGVLQPILVRPHKGKGGQPYELVAGARRFRASALAGFTDIPAVVRELSDVDVLEIQVVENDQREDVDPLEQADGYAALVKTGEHTPDTIALKIGRTPAYVRSRIGLANLGKDAKKKFAEGGMYLSAAYLVAALDNATQKEFLHDYRYSGPIQRSDVTRWIGNRTHKVADAKFDIDDPANGPVGCSSCVKNTAFNPTLFDESDESLKGRCTDTACWASKLGAHLKRRVEKENLIPIYSVDKLPKDALPGAMRRYADPIDEYGATSAPKSERLKGIYMDGYQAGNTLTFIKGRPGINRSREQAAKEAALKLETKFRKALFAEVVSRGGVDTEMALRLLARRAFQALKGQTVYSALGWKPVKGDYDGMECFDGNIGETSIEAVAVALACASELSFWNSEDLDKLPQLTEVANALGIDIAAKRAEFAQAQAEKAAKPKAAPAKPKKVAKK